jgi:hypothetical protein
MKTRMLIKLILTGTAIVLAGHWLKGHDLLTDIALTALFLLVSAKLIFAFIHRRGFGSGDGPAYPPYAPIPVPPARPKPPELSATSRRP